MKRTKSIEPPLKRVKKPPVSIYNFVIELQKWVHFTDAELNLAKESRIDTNTGPYFKFLVKEFRKGMYCKNEIVLGDAIKRMLKIPTYYNPR